MKNRRILECIFNELAAHGIKHASVDNIAAKLHMSKKTLYDMFENKEKMVLVSMKYKIGKVIESFSNPSKDGTNVLESIISNAVCLFKLFNSVNLELKQEIQLYPSINNYVEEIKQRLLNAGARRFEQGIAEGYLRRETDFEIMGKLLNHQITTLYEESGGKYTPEQIFFYGLMVILRGACTDKGAAVLEELGKAGGENYFRQGNF